MRAISPPSTFPFGMLNNSRKFPYHLSTFKLVFFQFDTSWFFVQPSDLILFFELHVAFVAFWQIFRTCWQLRQLNCWQLSVRKLDDLFLLLSDRILFFEIAAFWQILSSASIYLYIYSQYSFVRITLMCIAYKVENVMALHWPNSMCIMKMILPRISFSPS